MIVIHIGVFDVAASGSVVESELQWGLHGLAACQSIASVRRVCSAVSSNTHSYKLLDQYII